MVYYMLVLEILCGMLPCQQIKWREMYCFSGFSLKTSTEVFVIIGYEAEKKRKFVQAQEKLRKGWRVVKNRKYHVKGLMRMYPFYALKHFNVTERR